MIDDVLNSLNTLFRSAKLSLPPDHLMKREDFVRNYTITFEEIQTEVNKYEDTPLQTQSRWEWMPDFHERIAGIEDCLTQNLGASQFFDSKVASLIRLDRFTQKYTQEVLDGKHEGAVIAEETAFCAGF